MANALCEVGLRFESDGLSMGTVDEGKGFRELAQLAPQLILCVCTDRTDNENITRKRSKLDKHQTRERIEYKRAGSF
ncbi:hypothetical protein Tco_0587806 [Tanacetum coccineum]